MTPRTFVTVAVLSAAVAYARPASAHCDTTRGPVVAAARAALDAGDPALVLPWVRGEDEAVIRDAFEQAMKVRALGPDARALADRYFFETVVRIHRAGEGAPYTGITDAEPAPIIAASDHALAIGSTDELERMLDAAVHAGLVARFEGARAARAFRPGDVAAGRSFVAAYVPYTHWVEGVFAAASGEGAEEGARPHATEHAAHEAAGSVGEPATRLPWLPWALVAVLAGAVLAESALLARRRGGATAVSAR